MLFGKQLINHLLSIFCLASCSGASLAEDIPNSLFNISLGGVYHINEQGNDNIPKQKFAGVKKGVGHAIQYYFQPLNELADFAYVERNINVHDEYFETSFKLYLLPSFTSASDEQLKSAANWQVISIDWSNNVTSDQHAYTWAKKLCQKYQSQTTIKAEITDFEEAKWYECYFSSDNRVLNIGGMSTRANISLTFNAETIIAKEKAVKTFFNNR